MYVIYWMFEKLNESWGKHVFIIVIGEILLFFLIFDTGLPIGNTSLKGSLICISSLNLKMQTCGCDVSKDPSYLHQPLAGKATLPLAANCSAPLPPRCALHLKTAIARVNLLPVISGRLIVFAQVISMLLTRWIPLQVALWGSRALTGPGNVNLSLWWMLCAFHLPLIRKSIF